MRTILSFLMLVTLAAPSRAQDKEPKEVTEIGGRGLAQWIKDINHKDPSKSEQAIRMVLGFGSEKAYDAVPAMLAELRKYTVDTPLDTSVRVSLAISLGKILSEKKKPDSKVMHEAITLLTRLLGDSQGIVKYRAAQALMMFGLEAKTATTALLPLLKDGRSCEVRQMGAMALGRVALDPSVGTPPYVIGALQALLTDKASQVRQAACQALSMLPVASEPGLKLLVAKSLDPLAKKDPEPSVQVWANVALMGYGGRPQYENIEPIAQALVSGDVSTRMQAAQALGAVGKAAKDTAPTLISALKDPEPNVVGYVIIALGQIESARSIPALEKFAAESKHDPLKKVAREVIAEMKKRPTGSDK